MHPLLSRILHCCLRRLQVLFRDDLSRQNTDIETFKAPNSRLRVAHAISSHPHQMALVIEQGHEYDNVDENQLPYEHVQQLGHGHSGTVEEVRDRITGSVYARKTIRIGGTKKTRAERTQVFWNEVKIIRGLQSHSHIVSVYATYVTKRDFGVLLQSVASDGDLEVFLGNFPQPPSDSPETERLSEEVQVMAVILERGYGCLAARLAFMHRNKIRHKDIKP